jgi:hypothetical protein
MNRIVRSIVLALLLIAVTPVSVFSQSIGATSGEITVYNESGFEVTVYISGSEKGKLEPNYSRTYKVPLGSHRVEARTDAKFDKEAYTDLVISATYPYDSWYIHNADLN